MGRKRKPPELHVVSGTYRPDRHAGGPEASKDEPVAPDELTEREREHFAGLVERLEEYGLASASYTRTITLAAQRMAEIEDATEAIDKFGMTYETEGRDGFLIKPNPAVRMRSEAMRHLHSLLAEMGLTPASRGKVGTGKKDASGNPFADLA